MKGLHGGKLFCRAMAAAVLSPARRQIHEQLSEVQLAALRFIAYHPDSPLYLLAAGLQISSPAATKLVDRLTARGWVERQQHPSDRRKWVLVLTDQGTQVFDSVWRAEAEMFQSVLESMSPEDRQALERGLAAFVESARTKVERDEICLQCGTDLNTTCILHL